MIGRLSLLFEREGSDVVLALPEGVQVRFVASSSPDRAEGEVVIGEGAVRLPWTGRPLYLHLDDGTVLGARRVPLDGAMNFRDLGGYQGLGGRQVRWGRVFRADHLGALSADDLRTLVAYGIGRVIDFRGDAERTEYGHLQSPHFAVLRLPIIEQMTNQVTPLERIMRRELTAWTAADMSAMYRTMLTDWSAVFAQVIEAAAVQDGGALVFHCTAGKDRTGLAAALLLGLVGVSEEDILDDYELTNRYRSARRLEELRPRFEAAGIDLEPLTAFFVPPREAMATALEELHRWAGGFEGYAIERAGVALESITRLRESLLGDAKLLERLP